MTTPPLSPACPDAATGFPSPPASHADRVTDDGEALLGPLSYNQAWLWYLDQVEPGRAAYIVTHAWQIDGPLDVDALQRALQWLVDRHGSLRTTLVMVDGVPHQRVAHRRIFDLPVTDLGAIAPEARDATAHEILREESRRPFDLAHGPLFTGRLLRLEAARHWLILPRHHTIAGGMRDVMTQELVAAYNAFAAGGVPQLAPLPLQYVDFALWQREQLRGDRLDALQRYWRNRLANAPTDIALPTDRRRPLVGSGDGARVAFTLSTERVDALRALARTAGATMHMTLLAAFQVLLARYSGQDDLLVGAPASWSERSEFDLVVGMFVNTLVHRGQLGADPSFRALLVQTAASATEAYAHRELPIGLVIQALAPQRAGSRNPLFQVMYSLQPRYEEPGPLGFNGVTATPLDNYNHTAKFDLSLLLTRRRMHIDGMFEYSTDLFDAETIERVAGNYLNLLDAVVREPDRPVSELSLLEPGERQRIVVDWNATRAPFPADRPVHALFTEQARRSPGAIALVEGSRELDYATLDRRGDALARRLQDAAIAPGSRVGICIGRSVEGVVAMLGVLKAGCAYVPLDPGHPAQRIAALLKDSSAAAVVTVTSASAALAAWQAGRGRRVLELERTDTEDGRDFDAPVAAGGAALACVMYTSGSTGKPKGVAVPHRAIARLVLNTDYVKLRADDVVAHLANPAFDATTFEIWGPLLNGARVALLGTETVLAAAEFAAALDRHGVTTLFLTTALFNHVVREVPRALLDRQVLFGGEAADPRAVRDCLAQARPRRLLHVYGPTEATTFATWQELVEVAPDAQSVPIGRPIANTEVYVLDARGEPVPIGVPGEIHIGGPGLALGYFDDPDATANCFVAHPFDRTPGARLYKTGDRARYRSDGALEYLGRLDRQVKIRGHRIEPGEIEAALRGHPKVRDAVVTIHGTTSETRRIAAYVVPAPGQVVTPEDLWRDLRSTLPDYLLPGGIVLLQALPLTSTGKVDHRALPDPDDLALQRKGWHVPPRNPLEALLAEIWESLLGVSGIGVRDDFFDRGGHSLLAVLMIDRVERACGVLVPLTTLYAGATIEHLAEALRGEVVAQAQVLVALQPGGTNPPLFFLHGDFTGGGFYTRDLARSLGDDQPFHAVHPHGLNPAEPPRSIESMAAERLEDIRRVRPHGPYLLGGHCAGALVALEIARLLVEAGEAVPLLVVIDALAPRLANPREPAEPMQVRSDGTQDAFVLYDAALAAYRAAPYRGRIAVLVSEATRHARARLGWDTVSADLRVVEIPGDHFTSITRHVAVLGERMRTAIDDAIGSPSS